MTVDAARSLNHQGCGVGPTGWRSVLPLVALAVLAFAVLASWGLAFPVVALAALAADALLASWELVLPVVALAALTAGALLARWWLTRPLPKTTPRDKVKDAAEFTARPETQLWFALAAATSGLSLAAGVMVIQPWLRLLHDVDILAGALSVALPMAAGVLALFGPRWVAGRADLPLPDHLRRVAVVFVLGGLGMLPAASGMLLVGAAALGADVGSDDALHDTVGSLVEQRRSLILFLGVAAFIVVLAVVTSAALRQALLAHGRDLPPITLLLYGAYFSALIAVLFVPSYLAQQEAARTVVDKLVPISDTTFPKFPEHGWFERQSDLQAFLGLDVSVVGAFSAAFAVLTPVASAALATYLQDSGRTTPAKKPTRRPSPTTRLQPWSMPRHRRRH